MDTTSVAPFVRSRFADAAFFEEVSELTGIEYRALSSSFAGERRGLALEVVKTIVSENLGASEATETWTQKLREHAKAEGLGEHRPGYWDGYELTYEHNEFLRSIGRLH